MSSFDPNKLTVTLIPPARQDYPLVGRKYTLTHSDLTGELFLDVGLEYNTKAIDWQMRDEVLAEWQLNPQNQFQLVGVAHVDDGEFNQEQARFRFSIFQKEMSTALKGMIYGDYPFFRTYPSLLNAPIYIYYKSTFPEFNQVFYYGMVRAYVH